ncbi:protein dpy-30 homolog [Hippopotamus amphibius kiboko]|uniref:protein dpy-30 homolog n=1 Tax=Hippopotamus amphibius kiboko TaxID=575201 RepID=UPI002591905A|nr:protein dpy-30 homolog [Hippopotamus amphibius kiboko]
MDPQQMLEGQMHVAESPTEYSLTDNVKKILENEKINAEKSSQQKVDFQSQQILPTWIRQLCPLLLQGLAVLTKDVLQIPLNF